MNAKDKFIVELSSDLDYEEMVINIIYKEETVAILSQEQGINNLTIEILAPIKSDVWCFSFTDFLNALELAKKYILESIKMKK